MRKRYACTAYGEVNASPEDTMVSDAPSCRLKCDKLGQIGCCEWQQEHKKCVFQPNDDAVRDHKQLNEPGDYRYAAYCTLEFSVSGKLVPKINNTVIKCSAP